MKRSLMLKVFAALSFCFVAVCLSTTIAWSQQSDPLAGKWKMSSSTSDGDQIAWTLTIVYADGKYSATSDADQETPVKDLKVDGAKIHFRVTYQENDYDIDLTRDGESLSGTWSGGGQSGTTKGQKDSSS